MFNNDNKKYKLIVSYSRLSYYDNGECGFSYANTIEELQETTRAYIESKNILSSEWTGGKVYDTTTKQVIGVVAYNGKYFEKDQAIKLGIIKE